MCDIVSDYNVHSFFLSIRSAIRSGITMSLMSSFLWWPCMWTVWPTTPIWWRTTGRSIRLRSTYSSLSEPAGKVSGWKYGWNINLGEMECYGLSCSYQDFKHWWPFWVNLLVNEVSVWFSQHTETDKRSLSSIWPNCSSKVKCSLLSTCVKFILTATALLRTILSNGSNFWYSCMNKLR